MNFTMCKEGETWILTKLHVSKQEKEHLLSIGVYEGVQVKLVKQGKHKKPSLLFVNGRLWMMRYSDVVRMEGDCI